MKIVECVPNISEGRDRQKVAAIVAAVSSCCGVKILRVDSGAAANRSVLTYVGSPESVLQAGKLLYSACVQHIDMRFHVGTHPRIGSLDVLPFVPVKNVTMQECVDLSKELGFWAGQTLGLPIYLYENSAAVTFRRSLASIRKGQFENLPIKLLDPRWRPDYGPLTPHETAGASVIGARWFLIAFNVTVNTTDVSVVDEIARRLRTSGGSAVRNRSMPALRAIGWFVDEYGYCQVSFNLLDYRTTGLLQVFTACEEEASELGYSVIGGEIIGMVPAGAMVTPLDQTAAKDSGTVVNPILGSQDAEPCLVEGVAHEDLNSSASSLSAEALCHRMNLSLHEPFVLSERIL